MCSNLSLEYLQNFLSGSCVLKHKTRNSWKFQDVSLHCRVAFEFVRKHGLDSVRVLQIPVNKGKVWLTPFYKPNHLPWIKIYIYFFFPDQHTKNILNSWCFCSWATLTCTIGLLNRIVNLHCLCASKEKKFNLFSFLINEGLNAPRPADLYTAYSLEKDYIQMCTRQQSIRKHVSTTKYFSLAVSYLEKSVRFLLFKADAYLLLIKWETQCLSNVGFIH